MFKRILAIAAMVCVLPALANAQEGTLETWAKSAGGNIVTSLNSTFKQTSAYGKIFKTYSTVAAPTVTVTANPGYTATYEVAGCTGSAGSYTCQAGAGSVYATFTYNPQKISLTATAATGGKVSIKSIDNIFYGQALLNPIKFKFIPATGYNVTAITGIPAGASASTTLPAALDTAVTVIFPAGFKFTEHVALAGTFDYAASAPTAKAGTPQTVAPAATVILSGAGSLGSPTSYAWVQTAGPASVTLARANTTTASFTAPATTGTYYFKLTVNGGSSATATVIVSNSATAAVKNQCVDCHVSNGVGISPVNVYANWSSSKHRAAANTVTCAICHAGADSSAHPGVTPLSATCASCHAVVNNHTAATTGSRACKDCHDSHNPATVFATLGPVTAHPAVTLYTFEEVGMQMAGGAQVPVQVDANGKGMPYSPKQTCGTSGCHVKNGIDYTYDKISDHAFHSNEGRSEYQDSSDGKFNATKNKPWTQSTAMVGKW